jgi:hypothetical protein
MSLKKTHTGLEVYDSHLDLSDSVYNAQLTVPVCKIDSPFFHKVALVEIKLSRGKVNYYYTLDGSDPTTSANLYKEPFPVAQSAELKIMATMDGWINSKIASFPLMKLGIVPHRVTLETRPDPKYAGNLDSTLVDGQAGGFDRAGKEYLGFVTNDHQSFFELTKAEKVSRVSVSFLEDIENGVFPPEYVEVWGGESKNVLRPLGKITSVSPRETRPGAKRVMTVSFPEQSVRYVRLKAKKPAALPVWHALRKTGKTSLFIDEVSFN